MEDTIVKKLNEIADEIAGSDVEDAKTVAEGLVAIGNAFGGEGEQTESIVKALDYIKANVSGGGGGIDITPFTSSVLKVYNNEPIEFTWSDDTYGYVAILDDRTVYDFLEDQDGDLDIMMVGYDSVNQFVSVATCTMNDTGYGKGWDFSNAFEYKTKAVSGGDIETSMIIYPEEKDGDTKTINISIVVMIFNI